MWSKLKSLLHLIALNVLYFSTVQCLFEQCNHVVDLKPGEKIYINSPYYPNFYPIGTSCLYTIVAPINHQLKFKCNIQLNTQLVATTSCANEIFYFNSEGSSNELFNGSEYFCGKGFFERTSFLNRAALSYVSTTTTAQDDNTNLIDIRDPIIQRPMDTVESGEELIENNNDAVILNLDDQYLMTTATQIPDRIDYIGSSMTEPGYYYSRPQTSSTKKKIPSTNNNPYTTYGTVDGPFKYLRPQLNINYKSTTKRPTTIQNPSNSYNLPTYTWRRTGPRSFPKKVTKNVSKNHAKIVNNGFEQLIGNNASSYPISTTDGGSRFSCSVEVSAPVCSCGWSILSSQSAIAATNEAAKSTEFPSTAGVMTKLNNMIFCGATIIHHRYLLSAAHCFTAAETNHSSLIRIVVGTDNLAFASATTNYYDIASIILHEHYYATSVNVRNDIALLRTRIDIVWSRSVGPACLPFRSYSLRPPVAGSQVVVAGWVPNTTASSFDMQNYSMLRKTSLGVLSGVQCKRAVGTLPYGTFCTLTQGDYYCQNDSDGAPLYAVDDEQLFVVGISSYGYACSGNQPSVNTRVSSHIKWIINKTPDVVYCVK